MNCIKHGPYEVTCETCLDLEIAQELKWEEDIELAEDLEECDEYEAAVAASKE